MRTLNLTNKIIVQILLLAAIYHQIMVPGAFVLHMIDSINKGDFVAFISLTIPYYIVSSLYVTTIIICAPMVFVIGNILAIFFLIINKMFERKLSQLFKCLFFLKHINKYVTFYLLTLASFLIVITFGLYLPIWGYESLTSHAAYAPRDAIKFFYNYKAPFEYGILGFIIFFIFSYLFKLKYKKETRIDKFITNLLFFIKKS